MSKGNLFLGKARGRVGSVVFSQMNGVQVTRAYQAQVRNPRSSSQVNQRAIFATATIAASLLDRVVSNSFDGFKNGADARQEFIRTNIALMRKYEDLDIPVTPKGVKQVKPWYWQISNGNLGSYMPGGEIFYDLEGGAEQSGGGDPTSLGVFKQYIGMPFLKAGDQLTFVTLRANIPEDGGRWTFTPLIARIVIGGVVTDNMANFVSEGGFITDCLDLSKCEGLKVRGSYAVPEGWAQGDGVQGFGALTSENSFAYGVIGSQWDEYKQTYRHTASTMWWNVDTWDDTYDNVGTYGNQSRVISSDWYTEQADTQGEDYTAYTLEEVTTGSISTQGREEKILNLTGSNTYGPVAEGDRVTFLFDVSSAYSIPQNTVHVFNGETPVGNDWQITRLASGSKVLIAGPMPSTSSFQANISFRVVHRQTGDVLGTAAVRCNISKANA